MSNQPSDRPKLSDDDILAMARRVEAQDFDRIAPPPQVWNKVLAELDVDNDIPRAEDDIPQATVYRPSKRSWTSARLLSAAAATLLMVGVAVVVISNQDGDTPQTGEIVEAPLARQVALATMNDDGLPISTTETAVARVVCELDECFVEVDLSALPEAGADDLELWVINDDVTDMHSLGNVISGLGKFPLPAGVVAQDFPIVDISIEPDDGDDTHSGQSVLRGVFEIG